MPNRDIGIDVRAPTREPAPGDNLNPFNGSLSIRGSVIVGTVVSAKMLHTVVVEKQHERVVEKFERIEKRTRRYSAHLPSNIDVKIGDEVTIAECRPISKMVNFVVVENRGNPADRHDPGHLPKAAKAAPVAKKAAPKKTAAKAPEAKAAAKKTVVKEA